MKNRYSRERVDVIERDPLREKSNPAIAERTRRRVCQFETVYPTAKPFGPLSIHNSAFSFVFVFAAESQRDALCLSANLAEETLLRNARYFHFAMTTEFPQK